MHAHDASPTTPSQGVRTTISLLLFLHLFALFVAIVSNARPVSPMRRQLRAVPVVEPYLRLLHMDLAYNYHLTYASEFDTDHFFELRLDGAAPDAAPQQIALFPPPDAGTGLAAQRYRNLALNAAQAVGNPNVEGLIPQAVAQRLLQERGIDSGGHELLLRRHLLQSREAVTAADAQLRDPYSSNYYANAYEADVHFFEGELFLTKRASALETAPVESQE